MYSNNTNHNTHISRLNKMLGVGRGGGGGGGGEGVCEVAKVSK